MEIIGEYEYSKKDLIGHGAFAVVFKGRKRKLPTVPVAIKSITKKNLAKSQNLLSKEIKILKELADLQHENVVGLLDCKETTNHVYLVMEYCNGGDLADYLQAKGTLSEDTLSVFLRQIAGAMRALYSKGIVHRDLKPQNILLCHSGKPNPPPQDMKLKIADFGFARFLVEGVMAATLCGSPMYMAPEVIMSLQYGAKADLWSIGTIVFQCLTGKAPFQAQTPQQLKQFYERNSELLPNIPPVTSVGLRDLLTKLLKRNAKDRIDFESFFNHPFLKGASTSAISSPVPVPSRNHSFCSNTSSPIVKGLSASPLSDNIDYSTKLTHGRCGARSPMKEECAENLSDGELIKAETPHSSGSSNHEDFVMVPHNLTLDTGDIQKHVTMETNASPRKRNLQECLNKVSPGEVTSPTRPVTLPVSPSSSPSSEPIPVPKADSAHQPTHSPNNSRTNIKATSPSEDLQLAGPGLDIGSFSPPAVQFTIGTPPSNTWRRTGGQATPPTGRSTSQLPAMSSQQSLSPLHFSGPGSLPTILGSPTKDRPFFMSPASSDSSPPQPVNAPFGVTRVNTVPELSCDVMAVSPSHRAGVLHRCETEPSNLSPLRRLSDQYFHQQFHGQYVGCGMLPYGSPHSCHERSATLPRERTHSYDRDRSGSFGQHVAPYNVSPPNAYLYAKSPPNMEGPISFNVPELHEETLMDDHHNEVLSKLSYVLDLVECIMELAQIRGMSMSSFSESISKQDEKFNKPQRRFEQMVLYVRALQLLSKSLHLAKEEVKLCTIQPSNSFKTVTRTMNEHYHRCLAMCKQLHKQELFSQRKSNLTPQLFSTTANRLIYNYAIELCQTAALDEFFGNPEQCFRRYTTAQILLHSLAHQANDLSDKQLLVKYREAVEKRLYNLQLHNNLQRAHHYDFYS